MGCAEKAASSSIEMSGHGLEEVSREGKVAVLDEDGDVSESERLRLKAILSIKQGVKLSSCQILPMSWRALVCWMNES